MPNKGDRIAALHIMALLEENKGEAMRFSNIDKTMRNRGWHHNHTTVSDNLKFLIEQGNIVQTHFRYGIPTQRKNGTRYLIIKTPGIKDEIVEL